jgi:hypothetical protein
MKANGLKGDYCQTCAAILDGVQRNHRRVVVLDSQCAAVFHQSGDAATLDEIQKGENDPVINEHAKHVAPEIPSHKHKEETGRMLEDVDASPEDAAYKTNPRGKKKKHEHR